MMSFEIGNQASGKHGELASPSLQCPPTIHNTCLDFLFYFVSLPLTCYILFDFLDWFLLASFALSVHKVLLFSPSLLVHIVCHFVFGPALPGPKSSSSFLFGPIICPVLYFGLSCLGRDFVFILWTLNLSWNALASAVSCMWVLTPPPLLLSLEQASQSRRY